ncbi:DNA alkylation repair protein [Maricaulis sp. D1M11]|uniref:DNA alkylation repair protein n=1 Tax=Maricaulis sp. D1M11 TaxID=3076117 RepID=UPI0039B3BCF7
MPEPLKNLYSRDLIDQMGAHIQRVHSNFDARAFAHQASHNLEQLELKQRSEQIRIALDAHLPARFEEAVEILLAALHPDTEVELSDKSMDPDGIRGWATMPLSDLVGLRCEENFELALSVQKALTCRFSSEFGIRHLILARPEQAMAELEKWAHDTNYHVRRLASEGCRPRLPWAMQLPDFIRNPAPILPVLEPLKDDPSEYVRRSVANNLNDIAKDHPDTVAQIASTWMTGASKTREKLVRHACRTLVKQGHSGAMAALGVGPAEVETAPLTIHTPVVPFGSALRFSGAIQSTAAREQTLIVDYVLHFKKAKGGTAPKVFKLKTLTVKPGERVVLERSHPIRPITTRRYYAGVQAVEWQINGQPQGRHTFELTMTDTETG